MLERCSNTLLRRRVSDGFKFTELTLPNRGLRTIATSAAAPAAPAIVAAAAVAQPRYTSLAEIIPAEGGASVVESVGIPRTPMRNRLVEKAARAYLLPSDSFNKSRLNNITTHIPHQHQNLPWTQSFSRFLPRLSVLTMAFNPFNAFNSAFQVFRLYVTGARALQTQQLVSRSVSRSFSMPLQRSHDISIR